jgi:hypothetical protein
MGELRKIEPGTFYLAELGAAAATADWARGGFTQDCFDLSGVGVGISARLASVFQSEGSHSLSILQ